MSCAGTFSYIFFFQGTCFQNEGRLYESEAENDAEADRRGGNRIYRGGSSEKNECICRNAAAVDRVSRIFNSVSDYWMGYCIQGVPGD